MSAVCDTCGGGGVTVVPLANNAGAIHRPCGRCGGTGAGRTFEAAAGRPLPTPPAACGGRRHKAAYTLLPLLAIAGGFARWCADRDPVRGEPAGGVTANGSADTGPGPAAGMQAKQFRALSAALTLHLLPDIEQRQTKHEQFVAGVERFYAEGAGREPGDRRQQDQHVRDAVKLIREVRDTLQGASREGLPPDSVQRLDAAQARSQRHLDRLAAATPAGAAEDAGTQAAPPAAPDPARKAGPGG